MIGYITVGTNDMDRAVAFYDALFAEMGIGRFMESDTFISWAPSFDKPGFSVTRPYDGNPATVGNGSMVALVVESLSECFCTLVCWWFRLCAFREM